MSKRSYTNFVRPTSPAKFRPSVSLSGSEARKLYLEEVADVNTSFQITNTVANTFVKRKNNKRKTIVDECLNEKELFMIVQDNDIERLSLVLDALPDKINTVDSYGWSLLMIACQANAVDVAKELLKRGIDTTIRDKAGNSAQSLVIRNRNVLLADVLLSHKPFNDIKTGHVKEETNIDKNLAFEEFICDICNGNRFPNKEQHLSSTIHNLNASKGKKIPTSYVIPQSNKGYQIMLKVGWDKESGLGPDGSGKKYPIKAEQKYDKKGLGHKTKKTDNNFNKTKVKQETKKRLSSDYHSNRKMEINFRREFY